MELIGALQTYEWGKVGRNSKVALLHSFNDSKFEIGNEIHYAELWMGTHCNGPSIIKNTGQKLQDWIAANEHSLGEALINRFGIGLPFLFKVLSVNKALSIQAHPSKSHAEELHLLFPDIYKDPNHKPELAIALTQFHALCGFRPVEEIKKFVKGIPQLNTVIGEEVVLKFLNSDMDSEKMLLKECFEKVMKCPSDIVAQQLDSLLNVKNVDPNFQPLHKLLSTLHSNFPGDVGCFCIYFLNYITLNPGESIYLAANVPHAYLFGDCVECMSCSDNVVRAGLTPKFRDVNTLCNMLIYDSMQDSTIKFQPHQEDIYTLLYQVNIPDFAVANIMILSETQEYTTISRQSASIMLVVEGEGSCNVGCDCKELKAGSILFLSSKQQLKITCKTNINIYHAFANVQ